MTSPVFMSYMPPIILISPLFCMSASTSLSSIILSMVSCTFLAATLSTNSEFEELRKLTSWGSETAFTVV